MILFYQRERVILTTLRLLRKRKRAETSLGSQSSSGRREHRLHRQPWMVPGLRDPSREQERVAELQGGELLVGELSSNPGKLSGFVEDGEETVEGRLVVWEGAERGLREKERESEQREIAAADLF